MPNLGIRTQFWGGFALGILIICTVIQSVMKISAVGGTHAFFATLEWIGTFAWLRDYQTLITGIGAVGAAWLSVRAVRDQIRSAELASAKQIKHTEEMETARIEAKRAAARAVLPLALSTLAEYSTEISEKLYDAMAKCTNGVLPNTAQLPAFVEFPEEVVASLKEMIEYATPVDRNYFWQTLLKVQVLRARLTGLSDNHSKHSSIVTKSNIQAYLLDAVEISARAAALFDFGRGAQEHPPEFLTKGRMQQILRYTIVDDDEVNEIVERFDLKGDKRWGERWLRG